MALIHSTPTRVTVNAGCRWWFSMPNVERLGCAGGGGGAAA
eukprot:CAMPEP_0172749362 /NCGR_PEP_ID=MMETSP1074-20121228/147169_1 /TAXON_ID=2916 /ORGANISM="Ceratium fusus, Strain PA161109" /LENGTH=40 /DNA_ID= /DNA_START= /DNA_END= /DNA_ORIENTATION=